MADEAHRAIEAILMVADAPVEVSLLAQVLEMSPARVEEICAELSGAYEREDRGFVLARVAGGYRYQSHADLAAYVERFVLEGQNARLSAAALETLAIVAYKQPVSRAQIAAIRGVNADGVLRTLAQRGFVAEVGRDPGPGQAVLYGTTSLLLERLGLDRIEDLPGLAQFVPGAEVMESLEQSLRHDAAGAGKDPGGAGKDPGGAGKDPGGAGKDPGGAVADGASASASGEAPDGTGGQPAPGGPGPGGADPPGQVARVPHPRVGGDG